MGCIIPVVLLLQNALVHGFLFDSISDVVTVTSPVGCILGTLKSVTFDDTTYKVKEYLGMLLISLICEPRHDKTNKVTVRPAKTQVSLGIRPV